MGDAARTIEPGTYEYYQHLLGDTPNPQPQPGEINPVPDQPDNGTYGYYKQMLGMPSEKQQAQPEQQLTQSPEATLADFFQHSQDPVNDSAKLHAAAALAPKLGVSSQYLFDNWNSFAKLYGPNSGPPASLWQKIQNTFKSAELTSQIDKLSGQQMLGDTSQETEQKIKALQSQMPSPQDVLKSVPSSVLQTIYSLGYQGYHAAGTVADYAAALASGELVDKALGIKTATNFVGMAAQESGKVFGSLAGGTYRSLIDEGVNPAYAKAAGGAMAALETAMTAIPISKIPGLNRMPQMFLKGAMRTALQGSIDSAVRSTVAKYGQAVTEQSVYALMNSITSAAIPEITKAVSNHYAGTKAQQQTALELLKQVGINTASQAIVGAVASIPGVLADRTPLQKALREQADSIMKSENAKNAPTIEPKQTVKPRLHVESETPAGSPEGTRNVTYRDTATGEPVANIRTRTDQNGVIHIDDASLQKPHPDVPDTKAAIVQFMRDNKGKEIEWTPKTHEGKALKEQLQAENPRRQALLDRISRNNEEIKVLENKVLENGGNQAKANEYRAALEEVKNETQSFMDQLKNMHLQWFGEEQKPVGDYLPKSPAREEAQAQIKIGAEPSAKLKRALGITEEQKRAVYQDMTAAKAERDRLMAEAKTAPEDQRAQIKEQAERIDDLIKAQEATARAHNVNFDDMKSAEGSADYVKPNRHEEATQGKIEDLQAEISKMKSEQEQRFRDYRQEIADRQEVNSMIRRIERVKPERMRPEYAAPIAEIKNQFAERGLSGKSLARLDDIREYIEKNPEASISEVDAELLRRAAKKPLRDLSLEELRAVHDQIMYYDKLQRDSNFIMDRNKRIEREHAALVTKQEMPEPKMVKDEVTKLSPGIAEKAIKGKRWAKNLFSDHMRGLDYLAGVVGDRRTDSMFYRVVFKNVHQGDSVEVKIRNGGEVGALKYRQIIDDAQAQARQDLVNRVGDINVWRSQRVEAGGMQLTRGERVSMYMLLRQEQSRRDLLEAGFGSRTMPDKNRVYQHTPEQFQELLSTITPEEKLAAQALSSGFKQIGEDVAAQFLDTHNYALPLVEDYFPIDVMPVSRGLSEEAQAGLDLAKNKYMAIGMPKGRTIERSGAIKPVYVRDAFDVFEQHKIWASAYTNVDVPLLNAAKLLRDTRAEISARWGDEMVNEIESRLRSIAGAVEEETKLGEAMKVIRGNVVSSALGFNPIVAAANLANVERYVTSGYVKPKWAILGFMDSIAHPRQIHNELKTWSPEYRAFRAEGGYTKGIQEALHSGRNTKFGRTMLKVRKAAVAPSRIAERISIRAGMRGAFLQATHELETANLSPEVSKALDITNAEARKLSSPQIVAYGYRYADFATEKTNSTPMASMQSGLHLGKWYEQMLGTFGSDAVRAQQLLAETFHAAAKQKSLVAYGRVGALMTGLFLIEPMHYVILNYLRSQLRDGKNAPPTPQALAAGLAGSSDQNAKKARDYMAYEMADQIAYYFPILRDFEKPIAQAVFHQPSYGNSFMVTSQLMDLFVRAEKAAQKAATSPDGATRKKEMGKLYDNGAHFLASMMGIPYSSPKMFGEIIAKAAKGGPQ